MSFHLSLSGDQFPSVSINAERSKPQSPSVPLGGKGAAKATEHRKPIGLVALISSTLWHRFEMSFSLTRHNKGCDGS